MKNDGEYPLPKKTTGEGGLATANVADAAVGKNAQGGSGMGEVKYGVHAAGVSGHGTTKANNIPVNQSGAK